MIEEICNIEYLAVQGAQRPVIIHLAYLDQVGGGRPEADGSPPTTSTTKRDYS